jgi:hypothetical protein
MNATLSKCPLDDCGRSALHVDFRWGESWDTENTIAIFQDEGSISSIACWLRKILNEDVDVYYISG